jgi:uncharacterized protein (DUF736 family)
MMATQSWDNNLTGALFRNKRKDSEKQPDYRGTAEIDHTEYWVSGWTKKDRNGDSYMSLAFQEKEERTNPKTREPVRQTRSQQRDTGFDDMNDDVPF